MSRAAGLAHTRAGLQKRDFAAGKTSVVDKLVAGGATGPAAGKECLIPIEPFIACLLYTSDAADERSSVELGGRRIIQKKTIILP